MPTMIFVNLPVKDLERSVKFFTELGFTFNPQFTDTTAACMVVTETIYAMLLTEAKFQSFTPKPVVHSIGPSFGLSLIHISEPTRPY